MTAYDTTIDADSPVAHYKLGEASGTTLVARVGPNGTYSASGITYNVAGLLTANNGADTAVSFLRPSGSIGGSASISSANAQATFDATAQFSLETWITPLSDVARTTQQNVLDRTFYGLYLTAANVPAIFHSASGATNTTATNPLMAGQVYHLVYTFDGTTHVVYQDGASIISVAGTRTVGGGLGIAIYPGGGESVNATMDEVAVYTSGLTQSQVAAHYNAGIATADDTTKPGLPGMFSPQLVPAGWF